LLAAWYTFLLTMDKFGPLNLFLQYSAYYCGLFFVGCLYASTLFSELSHKGQGIAYLSVPASTLEKLLCAIFFGVFLFFIVYTLIFYIVDIPMVSLANRIIASEHQVWPGTLSPIGKEDVLNLLNTDPWAPIPDRKYHLFLVGYFAIQSAFLLGSVYFSSYSFIKTTIALLLFWLVLVIFLSKGLENHLPAGWHSYNLIQWNDQRKDAMELHSIRLPGWMEHGVLVLAQFICPIVFWFAAYFRLKEKQV
jgi:hypothetical protein